MGIVGLESQFLEIAVHFLADGDEFSFQLGDLGFDGHEVDLGLFLERIDVARDVEVVVVVGDLLRGGAVGVFIDGLERGVGGGDLFEVGLGEEVLVFGVGEFAGGVDEEHVAVGLAFVEKEDGGGDAGAEEEVGGQADDGFEEVFLDELLADAALGGTTEEDAVGDDDSDAAGAGAGRLDHVGDEGVVAFSLGREAPVIAAERVGLGFLDTPLVEGEGGIGDDDVELHEAVAFDKAGVAQCIAPLDTETVHAVQEHVHAAEGVGGAVALLAEESEVAGVGLESDLDEKGAGAAGGVANGVALAGLEKAGEEGGDLAGGVELTGLFPGVGGEFFQEEFVNVADHVFGADDGGAEVEAGIGEVFEEMFEAGVAILGLAELALGVEVHLAEDAFEFGLVGFLDLFEGDVDALADVGFVAQGVETVELGTDRELEAFASEAAGDAGFVALELNEVGGAVVFDDVADVFHEQHHEDVVLVVGRIDDAAECVAGFPGDIVDLGLVDGRHGRKGREKLNVERVDDALVDEDGATTG